MTDLLHSPRPLTAADSGSLPVPDVTSGPIAEAIVEQAITWYVRLASGTETPRDREAFARWHDADADHARAWARLAGMRQRLHGGAGNVAVPSTHVTPTVLTFFNRRKALKRLVWAGAIGVGLELVEDRIPWRRQLAMASADVYTPIGGRHSMVLPDGTRLQMSTDTAIDLHFDARERRVTLRRGEILITTNKDPAGRPFIVATSDGDLVPIGTRFTARYVEGVAVEDSTRLQVVDGAVAVRARQALSAEPVLVRAGQQVRFTRASVDAVAPADTSQLAWINGMFAAESMRLDDFLAELGRYRSGWLRCAPEVAALRITGVWPLEGEGATDRILDAVARRLPVQIRRYTSYLVTVAGV